MKSLRVGVFAALVSMSGWGVDFRAPVEQGVERGKGFIWLESEGFADYGDWVIDTQFTHKMGSAYLICPGDGTARPRPARTTLALPRDGVWRVWARTKDWLPEFSPGRFAVAVNGKCGADWAGNTLHALSVARASNFRWSGKMDSFSCLMTNALDRPVTVKARLVLVDTVDAVPESGKIVGEVRAQARPRCREYVTFDVGGVDVGSGFAWVVLEAERGVSWALADSTYAGGLRAWMNGADKKWQPVRGQQYCVRTVPALREDGVSGCPERSICAHLRSARLRVISRTWRDVSLSDLDLTCLFRGRSPPVRTASRSSL